MGKRSRRSSKGIDPGSRKVQLQQRRQKQLKKADSSSKRQKGDFLIAATMFVGDRVWYRTPRGGGLHDMATRGIIAKLGTDKEGDGKEEEICDIIPIELDDDGEGQDLPPIGIKKRELIGDPFPLDMRFAVGDRIVVFVVEQKMYAPCILETIHPIFEPGLGKHQIHGHEYDPTHNFRRYVPCYKCRLDPADWNGGDSEKEPPFQVVHYDEDRLIQPRPDSFRFEVGDSVVVSGICSVSGNPSSHRSNPGLFDDPSRRLTNPGVVTQVEVFLPGRYAIYQFKVFDGKGRTRVVYTPTDTDEYVASADATPRKRLMDSIEQQCTYEHIHHLISHFRLDVMSFSQLLIDKAIQYASYGMLVWLQQHGKVRLRDLCDKEHNNILHQIVMNVPEDLAERFFQDAGERFMPGKAFRGRERLHFFETGGKPVEEVTPLYSMENDHGRTFVDEIVRLGKSRLLQSLSWPAFELYVVGNDKKILHLQSVARRAGHYKCVRILQEYERFDLLRCLLTKLYMMCGDNPRDQEESFVQLLTIKSTVDLLGIHAARRLVLFGWQLQDHQTYKNTEEAAGTGKMEEAIGSLAQNGCLAALKMLGATERKVFECVTVIDFEPVDRGEFRQPELYKDSDEPEASESGKKMTLVDLATMGPRQSWKVDNPEFNRICRQRYSKDLVRLAESGDRRDIRDVFDTSKDELNVFEEQSSPLRIYRHSLLCEDFDGSLNGRIETLKFLIEEKGKSPPSPIDAIRWRSNGILRWLVDDGHVDLTKPAVKDAGLVRSSKQLSFMDGLNGIPKGMSTGVFLCLVAIEYDDLQSLIWFVDERKIALEKIKVHYWNVAHLCAAFGRCEMVLTLCKRERWTKLVSEPCGRRACDIGIFRAVHLAVERGYMIVADLLVAEGCPSVDSSNQPLEIYVNRSPYHFVQEWGDAKQRPIVHAAHLQRILNYLSDETRSEEAIEEFVEDTECLCHYTLESAGIVKSKDQTRLGLSIEDFLRLCFEKKPQLFLWICEYCVRTNTSAPQGQPAWQEFWDWNVPTGTKQLTVKKLISCAARQTDGDALRWLSKPWCSNLQCHDVDIHEPLLRLARELDEEGNYTSDLRDRLQIWYALQKIVAAAGRALADQFMTNASISHVNETLKTIDELHFRCKKFESSSCIPNILYLDGSTNLVNLDFDPSELGREVGLPLLERQMLYYQRPREYFSRLYLIFAVEGYHELLRWSLDMARWTANMEAEVTRVSASRGHLETVQIFTGTQTSPGFQFKSQRKKRLEAAVLGSIEGMRLEDLKMYLLDPELAATIRDPLIENWHMRRLVGSDSYSRENEKEGDPKQTLLRNSISGVAVYSFLRGASLSDQKECLLRWLIHETPCTPRSLLKAAAILSETVNTETELESIVDLFDFLLKNTTLDHWKCLPMISSISTTFAGARSVEKEFGATHAAETAKRWFHQISRLGIDVQSITISNNSFYKPEEREELVKALDTLQGEQRRGTIAFELLKRGAEASTVIRSIDLGTTNLAVRDKGGLTLSHLAAAYDQLTVLRWLVEEKASPLNVRDELGRTVLEVAEASGAKNCIHWIRELSARDTISKFLSQQVLRYLSMKNENQRANCAQAIQSIWRRHNAMERHRGLLLCRLDAKHRFEATWGVAITKVRHVTQAQDGTWLAMKAAILDMRVHRSLLEDDEELEKTAGKLNDATLVAINDDDETKDEETEIQLDVIPSQVTPSYTETTIFCFDQIRMTSEVVKWLRVGDSKYIEFFKRKIRQLAGGQSSRTLRKPLQGCRSKIFETYLEQISGHRILWTIDKSDSSLLIWYVAKHKDVSKLARLIDDAENRSRRQHVSADTVLEGDEQLDVDKAGNDGGNKVMLNPFAAGNSPLKLYEMRFGELDDVGSAVWRPRLHLTEEERGVVEGRGTVLLLGRSGTGKTLCICNRMDLDLQRYGSDPSFSQLFVSRSHRLRKYVKEAVGVAEGQQSEFWTFDELLKSLELSLPTDRSISTHLLPSQKMDFGRFRREVYSERASEGLDALVVWTSIRSFIKGSIEALQTPERIISIEDFVTMEKFGRKRCRLTPNQRKAVYKMFDAYNRYMKDLNLWDDCDRISHLLLGMEETRSTEPYTFERLRRCKVYVDEIQDYTQAEILLFFYLSGPGDLFLAGDPAQSVVEGVEFRFEEVRSVGYYVAGERRDVIPTKPKTVNVNFRSHSGVLNMAAAVLKCLFGVFPDSAKQLKEDRGLFLGPRPGVIHELPLSRLKEAVSANLKGAVVLTHDANVAYVRRALGDYPLVYGIREAKGLEFHRVVLLDFFRSLPTDLQKPWRDLLLGRDTSTYRERYPEVEGQLKVLYTAITRCIEQLFFIESSSSLAGDSFVRWITTKKGGSIADDALAERCNIDGTGGLTPDQLRSMGFDHAILAEESVSSDCDVAERHLETALFCFESVGDHVLARKVRWFRSSVRFRRRVLDTGASGSEEEADLEFESDLAALVVGLLSESLWEELRSVLWETSALARLPEYSQGMLRKRFLSKLTTIEIRSER